jgi:uncharacterized protein YndB with AHSA1/START domain
MTANPDRIEKRVFLRAPRARVWRAIADAAEFGAWFRVRLDGSFAEGALVRGKVTYPGYEHLTFEARIERIQPESYLAFRWHPSPEDPHADTSAEPTTLVEFRLEEAAGGTRVTIVESGFAGLPLARRDQAFRQNDSGWTEQTRNLERHVSGA